MSPEDPRHGSVAGINAHYKGGTKPCEPCREARSAYRASQPTVKLLLDLDDIALTDGAWRFDPFRRIRVWVPAEPAPPSPPPSALDLVACYSCGAKVTEGCRTKTGASSAPHVGRLAPRLCPCGASLKPRRRLCEACAVESDRMSRKRWREGRKKVAA